METIITLQDSLDTPTFYGVNNQNILCLKNHYPDVRIVARGYQVKVTGADAAIERFEKALRLCENFCIRNNRLTEQEVLMLLHGDKPQEQATDNLILHGVNGKSIYARSVNQKALVAAYEENDPEQRAKISLVNSITPFIDRIIYAVNKGGDEDYIRELTDQINDYNDILTHWIQLRQGELNLKIETFPLQPLFDIVGKGRKSFEIRGITLDVEPTALQVKADRVLTLFMLNTLADNARKFTPRQGQVAISATEADNYVEISVKDTGEGMTE